MSLIHKLALPKYLYIMKITQLLFITAIQVIITFIVFPFIPKLIHEFVMSDGTYDSTFAETYSIIFKWGVTTMLILSTIFIGKHTKYEFRFIIFSELFLAIIFYKNYSEHLYITVSFLLASFIIFMIRIPLRKLILKKNK